MELVFTEDKLLARNVKMYLYQRYSGKKLKEIGVHFGVGESRVSQSSRRVAEKIELYRKLERKVAGLEKRINSSGMKICPLFFNRMGPGCNFAV